MIIRRRTTCRITSPPPSVRLFALLAGLVMFCVIPGTRAVEVLSVHELVSHCRHLEQDPDSADARSCIRYIQGFIDGAVTTDVRVMLNFAADFGAGESFTERALRSRAPSRVDLFNAARLAEFCLGDPLPLREVVEIVVADLLRLDIGDMAASPAREAVYNSLRDHYPCADE